MKITLKLTLVALGLALGGFAAIGQENRTESDAPRRGPAERPRAEEIDSASRREERSDRKSDEVDAPRGERRGGPGDSGAPGERRDVRDRRGPGSADGGSEAAPQSRARSQGQPDDRGMRRPRGGPSRAWDSADRPEPRRLRERGTPPPRFENDRGPGREDGQGGYAEPSRRRGPGAGNEMRGPGRRAMRDGAGFRSMDRESMRMDDGDRGGRRGPRGPMGYRQENRPARGGERFDSAPERCPECGAVLRHGPGMSLRSDRDRDVAPAPRRGGPERGSEDGGAPPRRGPGPREPRG